MGINEKPILKLKDRRMFNYIKQRSESGNPATLREISKRFRVAQYAIVVLLSRYTALFVINVGYEDEEGKYHDFTKQGERTVAFTTTSYWTADWTW